MEPYNVLFLCTGNSARSVLAEALLNHRGQGRFRAFSAGSKPKGEVHPLTLEALERAHLPTEGLRSKSWNEFSGAGAPRLDFVFTVCGNAAKEECPYWPGPVVTAHWGVDDPAAVGGFPGGAGSGLRARPAGAGRSDQALHQPAHRRRWTRWRLLEKLQAIGRAPAAKE